MTKPGSAPSVAATPRPRVRPASSHTAPARPPASRRSCRPLGPSGCGSCSSGPSRRPLLMEGVRPRDPPQGSSQRRILGPYPPGCVGRRVLRSLPMVGILGSGNIASAIEGRGTMREPVFDGTVQIGIVVRDVEATVRRYEDDYGIGPWQFQQIDLGEGHSYREYGE